MHTVVVGSGAREHALQHNLTREGHDVIVTPGGDGIPGSVNTPPEELDADLFVIGPEQPLVDGLADRLRWQGKKVFGPSADQARLEGSKIWMKELLGRAGVRTAPWKPFLPGEEHLLYAFLGQTVSWGGWVVKTDYLAAGKGVLVTHDIDEAFADAKKKLEKGAIVIEQPLVGEEVSFFAVCSGDDWVLLPLARDYKRLLDGDEGPNTGGMGTFSPVEGGPSVAELATIIDPVLLQLGDYRGVLFGGLMITEHGIYVLEFNIRFGDPEIQSILPRLTTDLGEVLLAAAKGEELAFSRQMLPSAGACVTVVLASEGYPVKPELGDTIFGLEDASELDCVTVLHAGTRKVGDKFVTNGGRVLSVIGYGRDVPQAKHRADKAVNGLFWKGMQFRTDIAG